MINLIINEIFKVIKKRGFLIIILVMFGYSFLINYIYKTIDYNFYFEDEYSINNFDLSDKSDLEYYVSEKTGRDLFREKEKYDVNSWQYNYLDNEVYGIVYRINSYDEGLTKDSDDYELAKEEYNIAMEYLKKDDWKSIVENEKKTYEELLKIIDEDDKEQVLIDIEGCDLRLTKDISFARNYRNETLEKYIESKKFLLEFKDKKLEKLRNDEKELYYNYREEYLISEYNLNHDIYDDSPGSLQTIFANFFYEDIFLIFVMIFMIAGAIVSNEFSKGTIKLLLIKPYSRTKILLSKYITVLIGVLFAFLIMFIIQLIVGGLLFGFESLSNPVIVYSSITDSITTYNVFSYVLLNFIGYLPWLIIIATLTFCASTLFSNTALAIVTGFGGYIVGNLASLFLNLNNWWVKYIIFFHWDLTPYVFNLKPLLTGSTLLESLVICIIYLMLMLVPTFVIFKRKDINNV